MSKLRPLTTGGLPRNAEYVRKMWWRISVHESEDLYPEFREELGPNDEARKTPDWNEKSRSTEILRILEMCTKITSLDLDLRPTELDKQTGEFTINENETTSKFFYPISKLTQLTSIALTSPFAAGQVPGCGGRVPGALPGLAGGEPYPHFLVKVGKWGEVKACQYEHELWIFEI
ncbi:hypothetical protein PSTG_11310 [Puccinia striiformis f. sp. tritici PST-78]|uniref:Uncharacterized protein n=1 Tax=Puccinia striiformis f. sp. tritici PST-78 TaxID=1165861 RepID=A0A0L0V916_9BASI|nr:hypothetical protein PSTG_11310 [Puccinia striiformis f. sp. tritici PST-78]